jgi:hypothetical protein
MSIEAIKHYEAALREAFPRGATGDVFEHWNNARKAIAEAEKQEPVAWIEHEWSGSGLRHLHFERREQSLRDEVVNPIWTPLYTHPQPKQEQDEAYKAAAYLAKAIFNSLYANKEPYVSGKVVWELCDTTVGVITQIDNMVSQFSPRPPQPKREPLTDEQIEDCSRGCANHAEFARAIEAAHDIKEKNT